MNLNLLKKIVVWGLVLCAAAISPVIIIYGVPVGVGIVSDLVDAGYGTSLALPFAAVWIWNTFRAVPA